MVEGSTFCISGRSGDIDPVYPHGLFLLDTRALSRWELTVDGAALEPLTVGADAPYEATFVGRVHPDHGQADSALLVFRRRHVGHGMREQLRFHNHSVTDASVEVILKVEVDFADVFEVKESRVQRRGQHRVTGDRAGCVFERHLDESTKRVTVRCSRPPISVESGVMSWSLNVPAHRQVDLCLEIELAVDGRVVEPRFRCGQAEELAEPARRHAAWLADAPVLETDDHSLRRAVGQAIEDLGALRIFDPEHPDHAVVAAGAPWFMTLFGRDSLLASWMALLVDPALAQGVLETLARLQGERFDDATEEEPGRILHEVRFEKAPSLALGGASIYYGTADATPLFVMLAGELRQWGLADDIVDRMLPHVDRALDWIEQCGDSDGDGYVEYQRRNSRGLANQGWKDSWDGINFADGRLPVTPVALCEVQGYVYAAYLARADFALEADDQATFARYHDMATRLREAFNRDFWLEDRGWYAVGLDAHKQPIDALTSNIGHCLWTGIADEDKAARVADHLVSDEMFSGWGVRTLGTSMARYNPISYHNGSVWPHDSAICAAGLMRYGHVEHAHRIIDGLLDVADALGGRLPELFAGIDRRDLSAPAAYPTSCSPQAWAAAAPLLLLRSVLRFDPWVRRGRVHLAPELPARLTRLALDGVQVDGRSLDIRVDSDDVGVAGLEGLELLRTAHPGLPMRPGGS